MIFSYTAPLVRGAEEDVRAVVFADSPVAPKEWIEALTQRLVERKNGGMRRVSYEYIVFAGDKEDGGVAKAGIRDRLEWFKDNGVDDCVMPHLRISDLERGCSFLIVDTKHAAIVFPARMGEEFADSGVLYVNNPKISSSLRSWYELLHEQSEEYKPVVSS